MELFSKFYVYAWILYCIIGADFIFPELMSFTPTSAQAVGPSAFESTKEYADIVINYIWPAVLLIISWTLYRIIFSDE